MHTEYGGEELTPCAGTVSVSQDEPNLIQGGGTGPEQKSSSDIVL
jgi:hypothetical protein